jgi:hypothetical protein
VRLPLVVAMLLWACAVGACEGDNNPANPTPASIPEVLVVLAQRGIALSGVVSGDAGCADQNLAHTAVSVSASGFDQPTPTRLYLYAFRDRKTFQQLAASVDACARSYVIDPSAYGSIQVSPFVLAGPGPWAYDFTMHLRAALTAAAGNGG